MRSIVRTLTVAATLFAALGMGCADKGASIRLTPTNGNAVLSQHFDDAYAVVRQTGEMDVVLSTTPKGAELTQLMHLRVLWKPMRGTKTDQPSTTNATIDWNIAGRNESLSYTGAGFVLAYRSGDDLQVTIRNAMLKLGSQRGGITDPIGPATLQGKFNAKIDAQRVDAALATLRGEPHPTAAVDGH